MRNTHMSKFLKFIVNLVVICAILVAAALLVPPFAGVNTVMNDNSSKDTNLPVGSVAYGREIDAASLKRAIRSSIPITIRHMSIKLRIWIPPQVHTR